MSPSQISALTALGKPVEPSSAQIPTSGYDLSSYASNPNYVSDINNIVSGMGNLTDASSIQGYITQNYPNSPITGQMISDAASQYGVDPKTLTAMLQQESQMATDGSKGATMNNPGNVGNTDSAMAAGTPVGYPDMQSGVNAVAQWLSEHPSQSSIDTIASGIIDGSVPPPISARGTITATPSNLKLEAAIKAQGGNLTNIALDWSAMQKWLTSANSTTQLRLRQAISSVKQGIQGLRTDAQAWNAGGFAPINAANMKAALNGVYGQDAQKIAVDFNQQATIITDELGQTFMGGNSPTDSALSLAGKVISTNWSDTTLNSALDQLDTNLGYRMNAIETTAPISAGGITSNMYSGGSSSGGSTLMTGPDGKQYNVPNDQVQAFIAAGGKQ
jgi:hypothetical protein